MQGNTHPTGVHLVSINLFVANIQKVKDFYTKGLGMQEDVQHSAPPYYYAINGGSILITLQDISTPGAHTGYCETMDLSVQVNNVQQALQQAKPYALSVEDVEYIGLTATAYVYDPAGNRINLFSQE